MKPIQILALIALVAFGLASCAVTSGSTFSLVIGAEAESGEHAGEPDPIDDEEDPDSQQPDSEEPEKPGLSIRSDPDRARVYLDGVFIGETPINDEAVEPGQYLLRVERKGYRGFEEWIEVGEEGLTSLSLSLKQITGFLAVTTQPAQAEIYIGAERVLGDLIELPIGTHTLRASRFGYLPREVDVEIQQERVTEVLIELDPARFEVSTLRFSRDAFNPTNPGGTGSTTVSFTVTAPGSAIAQIISDDGTVVRERGFSNFLGERQSFPWDGRDSEGQPVPDGEYAVKLVATGSREQVAYERVGSVVIDSSLRIALRGAWSSAPGLLFVATPVVLPESTASYGARVAGTIGEVDGNLIARFPIVLGTTVGLGNGWELSARAAATVHSQPIRNRYSAGVSLGWRFLDLGDGDNRLSAAAVIGGVYQNPNPDGRYAAPDSRTDHPGGYLLLPSSLELGPLIFVAAPEIRLSPAPPAYGSLEPPNAATLLVYVRAGIALAGEHTLIALSAAPRFDLQSAYSPPLAAGAEFLWAIPASPLLFSVIATVEAGSFSDFYFAGGAGVSIVN